MLLKKNIVLLIIFEGFSSLSFAQPIPFGDSPKDSIIYGDITFYLYYYKPLSYDSISSPILFGIHGSGGSGESERNLFKNIADRRNALVITPTMYSTWFSGGAPTSFTTPNCWSWYTYIFKKIYRHILTRESRDSIPSYMIGFSSGGQFVTRYMLIRQAHFDSIPIKMAVSVNPYYYTFCTDSLDSISMWYPCGLDGGNFDINLFCDSAITNGVPLNFDCHEHIKQYYNENYGILIGTADTTGADGWLLCQQAQGSNRYERAQNFYTFSDSDAVARGTTLKWQYAEVPGVGHNSNLMYNTKADTADTSTIAETLLFDSPYYPPVYFPPTADFTVELADSVCKLFVFDARCAKNRLPNALFWNFGDGNTSAEVAPTHTYSDTGTYTVTLIISNMVGSDTMTQSITIDSFPPVTADFTVDTTVVSLPNAVVQFFNNTNNATSYLWDFGDSTTSMDISPIHQYTYADTFTVSIIAINDSNSCSSTLVKENYIIVTNPNRVDEFNIEGLAFRVYPNPFSKITTFEIKEKANYPLDFILCDRLGREVRKFVVRSETVKINRSGLSNGMYFYSISDKKKQVIGRGKIIVQ
ncbi:MAG: PKD domain-containing protein [Cytophagales bacterium]|nr:PKD domain-containing protein [Cytophagales bacterium]